MLCPLLCPELDRICNLALPRPVLLLLLLLSYAFSSELACIPDDGSAIAWFAIVTCFVAVFLRLFAKTTKDGDDDDDDDSLPPPIERELFLVVNCNAPRHGDFVLQSAVASPRRRPTREKGPPRPRKDDDDVVVICVVVKVVKVVYLSSRLARFYTLYAKRVFSIV